MSVYKSYLTQVTESIQYLRSLETLTSTQKKELNRLYDEYENESINEMTKNDCASI